MSHLQGTPSLAAPGVPPLSQPALPGGYVGELVAVLNETKSVDAFLITVELLQKMGADARPAVPAVIRNAERLGILRKAKLYSGKGNRGAIASRLLANLDRMAGTSDNTAAKAPPGGGLGATLKNGASGVGGKGITGREAEEKHKDTKEASSKDVEYEWERIWFADHPSHLTPERVDGAIQ